MHSPAESLHRSPVFQGLPPEALDVIVGAMEPRLLAGGDRLFGQGDEGDAAYVILSGRLRIERETPEGRQLLREAGRGEVVGEFAILTSAPRTATVTAVRDSELGRLPREQFQRLLVEHPGMALGLSRALAGMLGGAPAASGPRRTASVVVVRAATFGAALPEVGRALADALRHHGTTVLVTSETAREALGADGVEAPRPPRPSQWGQAEGADGTRGVALARWLQQLEAAHAHVVCVADEALPGWAATAVRQADVILDVLPAELLGAPVVAEPPLGHSQRELLIWHPADGHRRRGARRWMQARPYGRRHHARQGDAADMARLARHLTGTAIGVAFGGGGARGLSHLGLLRALGTLGIPVDEVGGTSIGSLVAAQWASGMTLEEMAARQLDGWVRIAPHKAYTIPTIGLVRAQALETMLRENFGELDYEDCWIDAFACSANLTTASAHFHRSGPVWHGGMASMAIPGIGPAFTLPDGSLHVDGAVVNNLPADGIRAGVVIAADVSAHVARPSGYPTTPTGWRVLRDRLRPRRAAPYYPSLFDTLLGSMLLGGARQAGRAEDVADILLKPPVGSIGLFEFARLREAEAIGHDHALAVLGPWWAARRSSSPFR